MLSNTNIHALDPSLDSNVHRGKIGHIVSAREERGSHLHKYPVSSACERQTDPCAILPHQKEVCIILIMVAIGLVKLYLKLQAIVECFWREVTSQIMRSVRPGALVEFLDVHEEPRLSKGGKQL